MARLGQKLHALASSPVKTPERADRPVPVVSVMKEAHVVSAVSRSTEWARFFQVVYFRQVSDWLGRILVRCVATHCSEVISHCPRWTGRLLQHLLWLH
jgi:hypothetical protein